MLAADHSSGPAQKGFCLGQADRETVAQDIEILVSKFSQVLIRSGLRVADVVQKANCNFEHPGLLRIHGHAFLTTGSVRHMFNTCLRRNWLE